MLPMGLQVAAEEHEVDALSELGKRVGEGVILTAREAVIRAAQHPGVAEIGGVHRGVGARRGLRGRGILDAAR